MATPRKESELAVRIGNHPGELARLLSAVSNAGVNILAYCAYSERNQSVVLLVTGNSPLAQQALESRGYVCQRNRVVLAGAVDRVGAAAAMGSCLGAAGINILYSYASSGGAKEFYAVFKTDNDDDAIRVLKNVAE
jgi:hypothetical protein